MLFQHMYSLFIIRTSKLHNNKKTLSKLYVRYERACREAERPYENLFLFEAKTKIRTFVIYGLITSNWYQKLFSIYIFENILLWVCYSQRKVVTGPLRENLFPV